MRVSRKKRIKKSISIYKQLFNIKPPYKIIVDATITSDVLNNKIYLKEQIHNLLNDKSFLYSTKCVLNSLENNNRNNLIISSIRRYRMHKCNHEDDLSANDCIINAITNGNPEGFIVATNDQNLIIKLRQRGVPIIRMVKNILLLDKPSKHVQSHKTEVERLKLLNEVKFEKVKKKKRHKKEPNPLSCLKKKKKSIIQIKNNDNEFKVKRKRYKKITIETNN